MTITTTEIDMNNNTDNIDNAKKHNNNHKTSIEQLQQTKRLYVTCYDQPRHFHLGLTMDMISPKMLPALPGEQVDKSQRPHQW